MHLILTGATGTCGSAVLQHCLTSPAVTRLTILSRSPVPRADGHKKAHVILHQDFTQYPPAVLDKVKDAHGCIWALGISANEVTKEQYIEIIHDYPFAFTTALSKQFSKPFNFVYVSGEGADPTERTVTFYGKVKGRTEVALHALSSSTFHVYAVRPGYIDPEGEILRARPRSRMERVYDATAPLMRFVAKWGMIGTKPLAKALVDIALGEGKPVQGDGVEAGGWTLRNIAVRRLAGL